MVLDAFKRGIFWSPPTEDTGRPSEVLLTSTEMLETWTIPNGYYIYEFWK